MLAQASILVNLDIQRVEDRFQLLEGSCVLLLHICEFQLRLCAGCKSKRFQLHRKRLKYCCALLLCKSELLK